MCARESPAEGQPLGPRLAAAAKEPGSALSREEGLWEECLREAGTKVSLRTEAG